MNYWLHLQGHEQDQSVLDPCWEKGNGALDGWTERERAEEFGGRPAESSPPVQQPSTTADLTAGEVTIEALSRRDGYMVQIYAEVSK